MGIVHLGFDSPKTGFKLAKMYYKKVSTINELMSSFIRLKQCLAAAFQCTFGFWIVDQTKEVI